MFFIKIGLYYIQKINLKGCNYENIILKDMKKVYII